MPNTETTDVSSRGNKVVIIGLDGGTYTVLDPLMAAGRMPNLARLIEKGVRGNLLSTIPPVTGPAWSSFMTGKGPGGHGLFDFVKPATDGYSREIVNFTHIRSRTIWSILSDAGYRVGVVGVPVTYPPRAVKGFVVSGLLTPSIDSDYTYPSELADEIKEKFGEYVLDIVWQTYKEGQEEPLLDLLHKCARQRWQVSLHLMKNKPWDVFMTVFVATDRIQHSLWRFLCPEGELDERGRCLQEKIYEIYSEIDEGIGELMAAAGEDTNFMFMSDHGFGPLNGKFSVNTWLSELGLLNCDGLLQSATRTRDQISGAVKGWIRKLVPMGIRKALKPANHKDSGRMKAYSFLNHVNWSETKAYSASNTEQGIYLNLKGREPQGIVEPGEEAEEIIAFIIQELKAICHPRTGEPLVNHLYRREEIYRGPFAKNSPDIVFLLNDCEYIVDVQLNSSLFTPISQRTGSGTHRLVGFFAGCGPCIKAGLELDSPRILDLAPTILAFMGVPIPSDMEGRVLENMFTQEFFAGYELVHVDVDPSGAMGPTQEFTRDEAQKVEKQLEDLGYISEPRTY